ncbi:MAG: 3-hydroxyacyl-CoA dehydrogenase NAD-binding domain-containing protein [Planctomycetota bacterium]|jgi:3-hydroxybutyryl-CoA dehydrogenase
MGSERHPQTIAVIGAGTMGAGIAQVAASHGCAVCLIDINPEVLQRGLGGIKKNLDRLVEKGKLSLADREAVTSRIEPSDAIRETEKAELVIEAVIEDLAIKQGIFRQLDAATQPETVLATNTSSLSVSKIADVVRDPSRVVGMHFFNPAPIMPLVEVIAGRVSARRAIDFAVQTAKAWGKTPVVAKDTPGFIVNRVARGYYLEALRLLGEGVAGVDEIDNIMRVHGGFKMGPFELMDLVGLDVNLAVSTSVWEQMNRHPRFTPHDIQQKLVAGGDLGRKTGRGFYSYADEHPLPAYAVERRSFQLSPLLGDAVRTFAERAGAGRAGITEQYIVARVLGAILNEAGYAFCENVATRDDIDVAMMKGTNYPKGPLAWAEEIGHRTVRGLLRRLDENAGDGRYEPAAALAEC